MGGDTLVLEQQAQIQLPPPPAGAERWQICLYSHTHWDREWYQPFERFRMQLVGAIDRILDTLDADPGFTNYTLDGQTIVLNDYLMMRPERAEQLKRLIRSGRIEIGPWYILPDEFLVSGESIVRNLLEGRRICRRFDSLLPLGYLPDPFGHIAQMPQILRGFGIDTVMFSRGMGDEFDRLGNEFEWRSPDGSSVLALVQTGAHFTNGYCNGELLSQIHDASDDEIYNVVRDLMEHLTKTAKTPVIVVAVGCDHETVNPNLPAIVDAMRKLMPCADVDITGLATIGGEARRHADALEAANAKLTSYSGELRGSKHAPILAGIFSARIPLKQDNVQAQTMLERYVEPLVAIAQRAGIYETPQTFMTHGWKLILANQPHDSIGGCSVDSVHDEMPARTKRLMDLSEGMLQELATVMGCDDQDLVFNPHPYPAGGIAELPGGGVRLIDKLGPHQLSVLESVTNDFAKIDTNSISNAGMTVTVDSAGRLDVAIAGESRSWSDVLRFVDIADAGDEYDIGHLASDTPIAAQYVSHETSIENGIAVLTMFHVLNIPAALSDDRLSRSGTMKSHAITTTLRLAGNLPWIECETSFNNQSMDHRLRVQIAAGVAGERTFADGHFAVVERPLVPPTPAAPWRQDPVPSQHCETMALVEGSGAGMAVLTRGLHEYEIVAVGDTSAIEVTLVRAVGWLSRDDIPGRVGHAGPGLATPGAQCIGPMKVEYAISPYVGDWQSNRIPQRARRFAAPPLIIPAIDEEIRPQSGQRARRRDLLAAAGDMNPQPSRSLAAFGSSAPVLEGIELSAIKMADDESGDLIVRGFNPYRASHEARLSFGSGDVNLARLDETPVSSDDDSLRIIDGVAISLVPAGGICTFRISPTK